MKKSLFVISAAASLAFAAPVLSHENEKEHEHSRPPQHQVPEPGSLALMTLGALAALTVARRKIKRT